MRDGRTVTHPGQGNPDIVEPAGPVDPEVGVIGAWDAKDPNKLLGCVVNFACHATTSPGGISANYIYYLEKAIQGYYGKDCVVVFLAGASGDVTQVDNRSPYQYPDGDRWAQIVGGKVGAEALKVLLTMEPGTLGPGRRPAEGLDDPAAGPRRPSGSKAAPGDRPGGPAEGRPDRMDVRQGDRPARRPAQEGAGRRGRGAGGAGRPGGVRHDARPSTSAGTAWRSRRRSGFPFTFPVSLANGCVGYVPTEDAFGPHGGGYETRLTSYSNLDITAGNQMRDAGIELARQLKPGPAVEPPGGRRSPASPGPTATTGRSGSEPDPDPRSPPATRSRDARPPIRPRLCPGSRGESSRIQIPDRRPHIVPVSGFEIGNPGSGICAFPPGTV